MTKRLLAVVLMLAMLVTMASFPVSAADYATAKLDGLNASNVSYSGATLRNAAKQNMDTLFDGDLTRTPSSAEAINGIQFNWTGSATKKTIEVTLNEVATVAELKLYWGNSDWNAFPAQTYNVYFAGEDGTYGEAAYSRPDDAATSQNAKSRDDVVTFDTPVEDVKSIKIEITSHYATGDPALREIEIFVVGDPASYTVEYVDQDGNPVADVKAVDGLHGATVTEKAPAFEGYELVSDETVSITLDKDATNKITFTYKKLAAVDYTINYVDEDGNPIADAVVKSSYETLTATETAIDVFGYELVGEKTVSIVLDAAADNVIEFVYKKLPSIEYTVKYVDANGNEIAPSKAGTAIAPYEVTEKAVYVEGFYTPAAVTKTVSESDKVIEIVYEAVPERMVNNVDNLLKNATASASSSYTTSAAGVVTPATNAVDGNSSTYWQSNTWTSGNPNDTYTIDLGATYDISDISIKWLCSGTSSMLWVNGGAARPSKYAIQVSSDGVDYTTVYTYDNASRYEGTDDITAADFDVTPKEARYVRIKTSKNIAGARAGIYEVRVNGYVVCDRVMSAPDVSLYAEGSSAVGFPFTVMTVDNVDPIAYFAAENWVLENCTVEVTTEDVSNPASIYYTWDIDVKVIPTDATAPISMYLDLPDSYKMTDAFSYYLEPSDLLFDSAIAAGQNAIALSTNSIVLNYNEDGTLTDASAKVEARTIVMMLQVQSVIEEGLPYEGYDDVVIELVDFKAKGDRVRFYLDEFVRSGDYYLASLLVTKAGVDQLEATIGIYGVKANGTKVLLDTRTITSDLINIEAKYPVAKTKAQTVKDYTFPMDILDQLIDYVHPADLPTYSDDEWAFFKEVLLARGWNDTKATAEIDRVKTLLETELAKLEDPTWVPTKEYADESVTIINGYYKANSSDFQRVIRMGAEVWNILANLHVKSFNAYGPIERPSAKQQETGYENDIVDAYLTFREGIDYEYGEKWNEGNGFCMRLKFVGASAEYANIKLGNAYNAVRRALNNDQLSPILFRLDWYNWAKNPFEGGVITVIITDAWAENYGLYNLATYHMSGYKYADDNDPKLELMEEGVCITNPALKEVSVVIEGAQKMYDTYVIVGTEVIPSDEPEVNGVYYDVK